MLLMDPPSRVQWQRVDLVPAPKFEDVSAGTIAELPHGQSGSHYYSARDVDANLLRIHAAGGIQQSEKFLFYRGVGMFTAPLRVTTSDSTGGTVAIQNTGADALAGIFLWEVRGNEARLSQGPQTLAANAHL